MLSPRKGEKEGNGTGKLRASVAAQFVCFLLKVRDWLKRVCGIYCLFASSVMFFLCLFGKVAFYLPKRCVARIVLDPSLSSFSLPPPPSFLARRKEAS